MSDTPARLLTLLSVLQSGREHSGPELARRLGVSVRTVRRDVDRLRALGYPVAATVGAVGGYRLAAGTAMPPLLLDDDEAVAVAAGLRAVAAGGVEGIEETSVRALAKLEQVLPARLRRRVSALQRATVPLTVSPAGAVAAAGAPVAAEVLAVLAAASSRGEGLRFGYRGKRGGDVPEGGAADPVREEHAGSGSARPGAGPGEEPPGARRTGPDGGTRRHVEPYRLVSTGQRWYLVAYDRDRADWRSFRVDRIDDPRPTGVRHPPRELPAADAAAFVAESIAGHRGRYRAVVTLHVSLDEAVRRLPRGAGLLEAAGPDRCTLVTGGDALDWLAVRIALLGVDFEVREPPELADFLRGLGDRISRSYPPPPPRPA
ncbi:helix-turn-helix transcriptional regulator [Streptomyces sp. CMB-StM0423]|uniref:helix-turn-helix transcriptional regulator n=1 Tax=Streptomyces sp. CMB-StM0423 TaxID=2059884 RepID=UPI000C710859|nr:WYL domain-containing protein [Streptomyces sp. CMB-StM0423]AUH43746.1 transcriptional regulator [Streptomyces sp. CMB-StM0423]